MQKHEREAINIVRDSFRHIPAKIELTRIGSAHGCINIHAYNRVWKCPISSSPRCGQVDKKIRSWVNQVQKDMRQFN